MIYLFGPHMALNADAFTEAKYRMWNNWSEIDQSVSRDHIINWTATVARGARGGKLKNLVINCHGEPGKLLLGEGFDTKHVSLFAHWAGLVDCIWITACKVARIAPG